MSETPFRPREKLIEKQKFFQNMYNHTHLKGPMDKITSVGCNSPGFGRFLYLSNRGSITCLVGLERRNENMAFVRRESEPKLNFWTLQFFGLSLVLEMLAIVSVKCYLSLHRLSGTCFLARPPPGLTPKRTQHIVA